MNYSELARKAGLTRSDMSSYILAKSFPGEIKLKALARAMGVELSELAPNRVELYVAADNPSISMTISPDRPGMARPKVDQYTDIKTAQKIFELLQVHNDAADRK